MAKSDDAWLADGSDTERASRHWVGQVETRCPDLTLLGHPDRQRIGDRVFLSGLLAGKEVRLARGEPLFSPPGEEMQRPLGDSRISRSPIRLVSRRSSGRAGALDGVPLESVRLDGSCSATVVEVDGRLVDDTWEASWESMERGVVLCLSHRIVLLLHLADPARVPSASSFGLIGASEAMERVRSDIRRLAPKDLSVLLRGETGTGKELVAAALHRAGPRAKMPFVAVNLAAVPPSLAAAELFGAAKGAYTGSLRDRRGAFRRAEGGTLFLDEIGDTPEEIQAMLLRTLESREVLPVGGERSIAVDVRLVTATDLDLEESVAKERFRSPLLYRVAGYEIHLPPLRLRREDFGRLFDHFLGDAGAAADSDSRTRNPWPPAEIVAELARRPWPGNIRQLRNAAAQLALLGSEAAPGEIHRWLRTAGTRGLSSEPREPPAAAAAPVAATRPRDIDEERLLGVLRRCRFKVRDAAEHLGISRAAIYKLIDRSPRIKKASDLEPDRIAAALEDCRGDLDAMVEELEVSAPALRRRMRQLGFD